MDQDCAIEQFENDQIGIEPIFDPVFTVQITCQIGMLVHFQISRMRNFGPDSK